MSNRKRALLIGGTGAIGVYLAPLLVQRGYLVDITTRNDHYRDLDGTDLRYLIGDGHDAEFIKKTTSSVKYDAIVDFMDYSTNEFEDCHKILLDRTEQYILLSTYRVYADSKVLNEESPKLLDTSPDPDFLLTDDYSLRKARQENVLIRSKKRNWTIVRPGITYSKQKFQLGALEAEVFLWRVLNKLPVPFPEEMLDVTTTMTWAGDVALMMSRLVNNKEAYGEDYIIATTEHHTWREVLDIYKKYIPIKVVDVSLEDFLKAMGGKSSEYQVRYDRMYNRVIDNRKILKVSDVKQSDMTELTEGIGKEIMHFIRYPHFQYNDTDRQISFNKAIGIEFNESASDDETIEYGDGMTKFLRRTKAEVEPFRHKLRVRTRLKNIKSAQAEGPLFFALYRKMALVSRSKKKKTFLFGAPFHGNLGDQAQTYAIEKWYKRHFPERLVVSIDTLSAFKREQYLINRIRDTIKPDDQIILHSGYHTTDLWELENDLNLLVIQKFPDFHIIVFPQTIHFEDEDKLKRTASIYNDHGNITLMCRDEKSYETAKKFFKGVRLELMPDVVTTLIGEEDVRQGGREGRSDGIFLCFRNDKESKYGKDVETIKQQISDITNTINQEDTTLDIDPHYLGTHRKKVINSFLQNMARHKLVITDRYHGTIFSVVSNTPVIVLGSTDHKLSSGVKWFSDKHFSDMVYYAESIQDAVRLAHEIYGKYDFSKKVPPVFNEQIWNNIDSEVIGIK